MQLIPILLFTVSILTVLSGLVAFLGSGKEKKIKYGWFLAATLAAATWIISVALFQSFPATTDENSVKICLLVLYSSAILMDVFILGYIGWERTIGRVFTLLFLVIGITLIGVMTVYPELIFGDFTLSNTGNSVALNNDWFYVVYLLFFIIITPVLLGILCYEFIKCKSKQTRTGLLVFLVGMSITGVLSLVFDLILPLSNYALIWIGPLAIGITMIGFYYATLKYHMISITSIWMKILSYVVIIAVAAIVYVLIFFLIFTALFKGSSPSLAVIVLNFIMILIVILLLPVISEISGFVRSLISYDDIDIVYIIKKLNRISAKNLNLLELADFLAEHLHFEYIGIYVDGAIYGSSNTLFAPEFKKFIGGLGKPEDGVWQKIDKTNSVWKKSRLAAVGALRGKKGNIYGQILIGAPVGKINFEDRDLTKVEMVIELVAKIIDSGRN